MKPRIGDYKEISIERRGKEPLRGEMWIEDQKVVVESANGRHKSMPVGSSSSEALATQMLIELEKELEPPDGDSEIH